ncbi:MAG: hypothetical protein ABSD42_03180 [Candidatus Bathyarchaeia archaeon]|jgi:DNA-binding HxlR family transcriptional regulator
MSLKDNDNRGIGNYQKTMQYDAQLTILNALFDGEWHQNKELKIATKLSSRTLNKNLKTMTEIQVIERKEAVKNGKYAVFYKTSEELFYMTAINMWNEIHKEISKTLKQSKDPLCILEEIHINNEEFFIQFLFQIQSNKNNPEKIKFLAEVLLLQNYQYLIKELITITSQIRSEINVDNLIDLQYKRQKQKTILEEKINSAILSIPEFIKKWEESQIPPDYYI